MSLEKNPQKRSWEGRERRESSPSGWEKMRSEVLDKTTPQANGTTLGPTAPWMAKLAEMILSKYGPLGLVLIMFLAMWAGWIASPITETRTLVEQQSKMLETALGRMTTEVDKSHISDDKLVLMFRMICARVSKTEQQTNECWGWKQ